MLIFILLSLLAVSFATKDCDFENGKCGWRNDGYSSLKFSRRQGSSHTGKGYVMSMDTRKGQSSDVAGLYSKFKGDTCLTFWYNMRGNGAGSIKVTVDLDRVVLKLKGPKGADWHKAQVEVTGAKRKITISGVRGKKKGGSIAIDDISFRDSCGGPSPPTGQPIPPTGHPSPPPPNTPPVPGTSPPTGSCGLKGNQRIVGGNPTENNEWPWQALLMDKNKNQFCGGSLIAAQWVLTAAHCIHGESPASVQVRLGAHKRKGEKPGAIVQDFKVIQIISHESYNSNTQSNDVALLKLEREANLNSKVNLVCLPESKSKPADGQMCWTTGWGTTSSGGSSPAELHEVQVPVVSHKVCNAAYRGDIDGSMICAGLKEGGKDACQGDSGGPFVCGKTDGKVERFYLHGATSWGQGCALREKYGVYARVSMFIDWIQEKAGIAKPGKPGKPTQAPAATMPPVPGTNPPSQDGCGRGFSSRIVGGVEAGVGDWTWQALLQSPRGIQFCGGTLVDAQWVMTASHCVDGSKPKDIVIRMGAHHREESDAGVTSSNEQKFKVSKIIMHKQYDSNKMNHDVALLKLERPANLNRYVGLACLPASDPIPGKSCVITGWGTLSSGGNQPSELQVAHVPIVKQDDCNKKYNNQIHESMVCAGYPEGGKDSCQGDSGGPLVCKRIDGRYSVHGITSWGYGCAAPNYPGVYARVSFLLKWIKEQIKNN